MTSNAAAVAVVLLGVLTLTQVFRGRVLQRLGVISSGDQKAAS